MAHQRGQLDQVLALREGTCDETPFAVSLKRRKNCRFLPTGEISYLRQVRR